MLRTGFLCVLGLLLSLPSVLSAQPGTDPSAAAASSDWIMPRTEHGHPNLQGTWFFGSRTPMQRPTHLGLKAFYTGEEAAALEAAMRDRLSEWDRPLDPERAAPELGAPIRQEADDAFLGHYLEPILLPINGRYRTSVIYEPPNGRLPLREDFMDFHARRRAAELADTDGPEGQTLSGRCIMFGGVLPSLTPVMMNPNMQIVQTGDHVVIATEMIHDARIIRLNDSHRAGDTPRWMGDSIAHWEGDTLVVHSTGFREEQSNPMFIVHSDALEIEERYTLVAENQIHYAFTATDPKAFTQAVRGERIITRNAPGEVVYEYGCHEGNLSLVGILRGARRLEQDPEYVDTSGQDSPDSLRHHSTIGAPAHQ